MSDKSKPQELKLLVVIVDRADTEKVVEILTGEHVRFHFISMAEGTAGSDTLSLLGLDSLDKSLICCMDLDFRIPSLLSLVAERLNLRKPGKGIAFTVPVNGVNNSVLQFLKKDIDIPELMEDYKMKGAKQAPIKYDLILSVINQGHVDKLMESAKAAGARGGTVMHGRRIGVEEEATKLFGVSMQSEKDVVTILTTHKQKNEIMRAISQSCGMNTDAHGVIFSVPVENIEGLRMFRGETKEETPEGA